MNEIDFILRALQEGKIVDIRIRSLPTGRFSVRVDDQVEGIGNTVQDAISAVCHRIPEHLAYKEFTRPL